MSLRTKCLLAATGLAIALAGVFFGGPGHVFWPSVVGGLLISPLWTMLESGGGESSESHRTLFDDTSFGDEPSSIWRSADPNHISNGGPNIVEWSDS